MIKYLYIIISFHTVISIHRNVQVQLEISLNHEKGFYNLEILNQEQIMNQNSYKEMIYEVEHTKVKFKKLLYTRFFADKDNSLTMTSIQLIQHRKILLDVEDANKIILNFDKIRHLINFQSTLHLKVNFFNFEMVKSTKFKNVFPNFPRQF